MEVAVVNSIEWMTYPMHLDATGVLYKIYNYIVLAGKYGDKTGVMKPFDSLTSAEIKEELLCRSIVQCGSSKKRFNNSQRSTACFQFINYESFEVTEMRLNSYEILDSEP